MTMTMTITEQRIRRVTTWRQVVRRAILSERCSDVTSARIFRRYGKTFTQFFRSDGWYEHWTTEPISGMRLWARKVSFIGTPELSADDAWRRYLDGQCVYPAAQRVGHASLA